MSVAKDVQMTRFQPTRPRGARPLRDVHHRPGREVSTHAPTRGATWASPSARWPTRSFNPRAHAGRDRRPVCTTSQLAMFQPTRPRGARRAASFRPPTSTNRFNPRAHAGRDLSQAEALLEAPQFQPTRPRGARPSWRRRFLAFDRVSTHAPTRGATCALARLPVRAEVSTHAPTRGATPRNRRRCRGCRSFNPRAHAGRDPSSIQHPAFALWFQPTRPRGARHADPSSTYVVRASFNPRAHAGRDPRVNNA